MGTAIFFVLLGVPLFAVAVFAVVVVPIWAVIDAATTPDGAWRAADQNKILWIVLIVVLWAIGGAAYLVAIRPKLRAAQSLGSGRVSWERALRPGLAALLVILSANFFTGLVAMRPEGGTAASMDDLRNYLDDKRVTSARFLDMDQRLVFTVAPHPEGSPQRMVTSIPRGDAAKESLLRALFEQGAPVTVENQQGKYVVRVVTMFVLSPVIVVTALALVFVGRRRRSAAAPPAGAGLLPSH